MRHFLQFVNGSRVALYQYRTTRATSTHEEETYTPRGPDVGDIDADAGRAVLPALLLDKLILLPIHRGLRPRRLRPEASRLFIQAALPLQPLAASDLH